MKKILLSAVATVALSATAFAADLPVQTKAPVYVPSVFSWTGFYIGGHVGGSWGTTSAALDAGVAPFFFPASFPLAAASTSGVLGGGQAGYNWQAGAFVLGVQGDIAAINNKGSAAPVGFLGGFFSPAALATANSNWLATATGRIGGVVLDRILVYAKGGGAWLNRSYGFTDPLFPLAVSQSSTRSGWTLGVGTEYAITNNWTAFVEYDYMDFGTKSIGFANPITAPFAVPVSLTDKLNMVKGGANYKF